MTTVVLTTYPLGVNGLANNASMAIDYPTGLKQPDINKGGTHSLVVNETLTYASASGSTFTLSIPAYPETDDEANQEARDEEAVAK